ncbi:HlyIII-domain-containing protein [Aspergillus coremiiformis]|uniref:HlyIII-domain-containing protein n=1 Tax=Aspergillus coremiiformis TaxID=138285 RepID=A0A5N6ZCF3_9EURO|nr:HlyIII-domain-containing protein [Aspergillus coremiiformis]
MATTFLRLSVSYLLDPLPPKGAEKKSSDEPEPPRKQNVFHISEIPRWMQWDPYILHGYRAQLDSFERCFWSLFYLHNESINTWSHMLPGLYFLTVLLAIDYWITQLPLEVPVADILAIQTYVAGTAGCLIFSAAFHATNAHSPEVAHAFLKLDYLGIVLTISTTCISVAYFGLYGEPAMQALYIVFTIFSAVMAFWVALDRRMDGARAGPWRATVFFFLAASGLAPICHVAWNEGWSGLTRIPLDSLSVTCTSYAIGTAAYVTRFPEKFWPERFDLIGASHQIFHILVAFGQMVHLFGLREVLLRVHMNVCTV